MITQKPCDTSFLIQQQRSPEQQISNEPPQDPEQHKVGKITHGPNGLILNPLSLEKKGFSEQIFNVMLCLGISCDLLKGFNMQHVSWHAPAASSILKKHLHSPSTCLAPGLCENFVNILSSSKLTSEVTICDGPPKILTKSNSGTGSSRGNE